MEERVKKVLKEKVDPILAQHYGASQFSYMDGNVAYVKLTGECAACPAATDTIETVVKSALIGEIPELEDVCLDLSVSDDLWEMAKKVLNHEV